VSVDSFVETDFILSFFALGLHKAFYHRVRHENVSSDKNVSHVEFFYFNQHFLATEP
jgi:hypothetical protein